MKLLTRLDAESKMDRIFILVYAILLNLPYVKEDLVEYMEFLEVLQQCHVHQHVHLYHLIMNLKMKNRIFILGEIIEIDIWNVKEINNCFKYLN
jgi:hypothetical protein